MRTIEYERRDSKTADSIPQRGGGGDDLSPPGPRVVQRKHTWYAPGLQILKLDRTDSGGNPDDHEDAYYSPES